MIRPTLVSPRFDFGWFVAPGVIAAAVALWLGLGDSPAASDSGVGLWIAGVLLVDVAHVYASLFRTYLDPGARVLHRKRLIIAPLLCAWLGFLAHLESPLLFWSLLAYVAIFHFIKQHVGFALLYVRAGGEGRLDRRLTEAAVWATTAGPVLWWHAHLPTRFSWFVPGDLMTGLPAAVGTAALWLEVPIVVAFVARRLWLRKTGHRNPMVPWLVAIPAINWHLGIVVFNDDRIFTITNVFLHGIPYMALVWITGGRAWARRRVGGAKASVAAALAAYYGTLVALAIGEEALWDRLVWHDHPQLFGTGSAVLVPGSLAAAAVVALLTVPQATHYILDRFIWRVGPRNPELAGQLGLAGGPGP